MVNSAPATPSAANRFFFALSVPDSRASARWYQDVVGLSVEHELEFPDSSGRAVILSSPHLVVELMELKAAAPPPAGEVFLRHGIYKVGLFVDDLPARVHELKAKGVEFLYDLIEDPSTSGLRFVVIKDNAGNLVQLYEPLPKKRS